jgi:hypothetical protein
MSAAGKLKNVKWRKISSPTTWRPQDGEELIGYYVGRTQRDGSFGPYEVVLVAVPYKGTFMVSGTKLIQLADSAMLTRGDAVRVVFLGKKEIGEDREMKDFELYVGELPMADDMPADETAPEPS